jgi:plasmid stabilization system protein ParE
VILPLTVLARRQLLALTSYYVQLERDEAVRNLIVALERASERIQSKRGQFYNAPRPYPALARLGVRWRKEGPYWIAFATDKRGSVIQAVFHQAADIPNRI